MIPPARCDQGQFPPSGHFIVLIRSVAIIQLKTPRRFGKKLIGGDPPKKIPTVCVDAHRAVEYHVANIGNKGNREDADNADLENFH